MNCSRRILMLASAVILGTTALLPGVILAQASSASSTKTDQWIHVRVESRENHGETVRVNVPVEMAEKVLPAINKDNFRDGKVHVDSMHTGDVDLKMLIDAVRTSRDGEYVTVQSNENNVRVAKSAGYLYIHVTDKSDEKKQAKDAKDPGKENRGTKVEIKVPMKVVDALFSSGKDELDIVAALKALSSHGDTELVTVKDSENSVRIWVDSKNSSD